MKLLDGKEISAALKAEVERAAAVFLERAGRKPSLHVVLVGEDPASQIYVRNKKRACQKAGLESVEHALDASTSQAELLALVARLNGDDAVDGILVQLPLPPGIDEGAVIAAIDPAKDADGFHPISMGNLVAGRPGLAPCTPLGCMRMIDHTGEDLSGMEAVVVGRSNIVGKPMAHLLLRRHATVTICHSRTRDLAAAVGRADLVVAAVGVPGMVKGAWIKPGAIVIDVGINRLPSGAVVGDVEFGAAAERAAWITPVPGGVGPMTIACLLENTVTAATARAGLERPR